MQINPDEFLHIYNQGNNREQIFFDNDNYLFFLDKVRRFILPVTDIVAYCLMPNHFHFLVRTTNASAKTLKVGSLLISQLANGFRSLQSSYAQGINKRYHRTGSLFRQKTKMKLLTDENHIVTCMHYIHQNPIKAALVERMENWTYSSFSEYVDFRPTSICKPEIIRSIVGMTDITFYDASSQNIDESIIRHLYLHQASDGS